MSGNQTKILFLKLFALNAVFIFALGYSASASVNGNYFQDEKLGLTLMPGKSDWIFLGESDYGSRGNIFVARAIGAPSSASLTLRTDKSKIETVKKYTDKWLRDYPKFGYELQLAQEAAYGDLRGFEIELLSRNGRAEKKIHQLIVKNDDEFLIFTCSASSARFAAAWKNCQEILKSSKMKRTPTSFAAHLN